MYWLKSDKTMEKLYEREMEQHAYSEGDRWPAANPNFVVGNNRYDCSYVI